MNEKILEEKVRNFGEEKAKLERKLTEKYEPQIKEFEIRL